MSFLDRVDTCNTYDLAAYRPFVVGNVTVGWVREPFLSVLTNSPAVFNVEPNKVEFLSDFTSADDRSEALAHAAEEWTAQSLVPELSGEVYPARQSWTAPDLFRLDRALVPFFGVRAYGVHLNGYVTRDDGIHIWLGRRSESSRVEPGKLDSMVGGGQPAGLSLVDNLIKECGEEASIPETLARQSQPIGTVTYCFDGDRGLKPDTLFCYDLAVPEDFKPVNQDGEISDFHLTPLREALDLIETSESFKFNVSLVVLDFAIRHGVLRPDEEPDYEAILAGIHAPLP